VAVVLAEAGGQLYVLDVKREQVAAPQFAATLRGLQAVYQGAPMFAFIGGTEKGTVDFLGTLGLHIYAQPAKTDKFVRAQPVAASWNAGKVALPRTAPWVNAFVSEVLGFTGIADPHDDQVDALAGAFACLTAPRVRRDFSNLPQQ
jgi:predicted phage terminase large subunit-like protein